jgi:hypothetical protein
MEPKDHLTIKTKFMDKENGKLLKELCLISKDGLNNLGKL